MPILIASKAEHILNCLLTLHFFFVQFLLWFLFYFYVFKILCMKVPYASGLYLFFWYFNIFFFVCFTVTYNTYTERKIHIKFLFILLTYLHNLEMNLIWFNWCCLNHEQLIFVFLPPFLLGIVKKLPLTTEDRGDRSGLWEYETILSLWMKYEPKLKRSKYRREEERPREAIRWCPFIKFYSEVM